MWVELWPGLFSESLLSAFSDILYRGADIQLELELFCLITSDTGSSENFSLCASTVYIS